MKSFIKTSVEDVLNWYKDQDLSLFIIGGEKVIRLFEPYLEELYQTVIDAELEGDTYFPEDFQWDQFRLLDERTIEKDEKTLTTLPLDILKERKTSSWNVVFLAFYSCFMRDLPSMCFPDLSEKALWLSHALLVKCLY